MTPAAGSGLQDGEYSIPSRENSIENRFLDRKGSFKGT